MTTLTRRAAFTDAIASIAAARVATAATTTPPAQTSKGTEPDSAEWNTLLATYFAARVEEVRLHDLSEERQEQWYTWRRHRESEPAKPEVGPLNKSLSLTAILAQTKTPAWRARWADYEAARTAWQARNDAAEEAFMGDREARFTAASEACDDAFAKVKAYPVSSIAMLGEKAAAMNHRYAGDFEGHDAEALMVDIARLAKMEG